MPRCAARFLAFVPLLALVFAGTAVAREAGTPLTESSHEEGEAPVLRVFSAEDSGRRYVAYLVEWKGREVVVSDPLCRSDHQAGDTIAFMVHMGRALGGRGGQEKVAPLSFLLLDRPGRQPSTDEAKRLRRLARGDLDAAANDEERFYALGDAARNALEKGEVDAAQRLAVELEELAPAYRGNWNFGNAVQDANQVLGRIALAAGDVEEAKRRLLASADSKGSPQMNSFGPNMTLAKELLAHGERDVVLRYFQRCGAFWEMGDEELADWTDQVERGETPDFGANLKY